MTKLFSAVLIFGLIGFNFDISKIPEIPNIDVDEIVREAKENVPESSFGTYSDPEYKNKTTNFSSGQLVYLFAEAKVDKSAQRSLDLKDENKNHIRDIDVLVSDKGYYSQFNAPQEEGMYYLHLEISGEGLSIVFQTNINVGISTGGVVVENTVVNNVSSGGTETQDFKEIGEDYQKVPRNRLNILHTLGHWIVKMKELIINFQLRLDRLKQSL